MNKVYNIFAKLWCQHNTVATMLITNMNEIVYASGVKQRDYKNKEKDDYFSFDTFNDELLFSTKERCDYSVISLSHKYGDIVFVIIIYQENNCHSFLIF